MLGEFQWPDIKAHSAAAYSSSHTTVADNWQREQLETSRDDIRKKQFPVHIRSEKIRRRRYLPLPGSIIEINKHELFN